MSFASPPIGMTPPAPGLEREEPEFAVEEDIPTQHGDEREAEAAPQDDGALRDVERE